MSKPKLQLKLESQPEPFGRCAGTADRARKMEGYSVLFDLGLCAHSLVMRHVDTWTDEKTMRP